MSHWWCFWHKHKKWLIVAVHDGIIFEGAHSMTMNIGQTTTLGVQPWDAANGTGNEMPVPAGATVAFASSDATVISLVPSADGLTAVGKANSAGSATVTATLTLPDGATFTATLPVTVVPAVVVPSIASITITATTPA